ncbi:leucine-rich repeat protein [Agathobaculum sp.]|uniref:leucine-rich repeat protein n=1 Tax=Agathobaculum sp. TaxID=2048138 RepID=UPI0027BB103A|nr:leucine-rich repeat protein [Agathobaculum sp.]
MKKRILASLLSLCLLVGLLPTAALAIDEESGGDPSPNCTMTEGCTLEDGHEGECTLPGDAVPAEGDELELLANDTMSGNCGADGNESNVTWSLEMNNDDVDNPTYTLTISGEGAMKDYTWNDDTRPWMGNLSKITKLIVEEGVTNIGAWAFAYAKNLKEIDIAESVTVYGMSCLEGCDLSGEISFSANVTQIQSNAFYSCEEITAFQIPEDNAVYRSVDGIVYSKEGKTLVLCPPGKTGAFDADWLDGVKIIAVSAFRGCSQLTGTLTIPDSVKAIGPRAFQYCSNLTGDLTIPDSVTGEIGEWTFGGCGFTGTLSIGDGITSIGDYAFSGCKKATVLVLGNGIKSIGTSAFKDCSELSEELKIPEGVLEIGAQAFIGCSGLKGALVIPDTVTGEIGAETFKDCGFASITIGDGITSIGARAFQNCKDATSLTLGNSVVRIDETAFNECTNFAGDLVIPDSMTGTLGAFFRSCGFNGKLTVGDGITAIGNNAFQNCKFTSLELGNSIESIGERAFFGCSSLTGDLVIPDSVESIGKFAFMNCSGLTGNLILSQNLKSLGQTAFSGCKFTGTVIIPAGIETILTSAFYGSNVTSFVIPDSVKTINTASLQGSNEGYIVYFDNDTQRKAANNIGACNNSSIYAVTNGGIFAPGTDFTANTLAEPIRNGYKFVGWYSTSTCIENSKVTESTNLVAKTCYYAKWENMKASIYSVAESLDFGSIVYGGTVTGKEITATLSNSDPGTTASIKNAVSSNADVFTVGTVNGNSVTVTPAENLPVGSYSEIIYVTVGNDYCYSVPVTLTVTKTGSSVTPDEGKGDITATYGDVIIFEVETAKAPANNKIALMTGVEQDQVVLKYNDVVLGSEQVEYADDTHTTGTATIVYDTSNGDLPIGQGAVVTAEYSGSVNLNGSDTNTIKVTLNRASLSIAGLEAPARAYDSTNSVSLIWGKLIGVIGSDEVTAVIPANGTMENADVGADKPVTVPTIELTGKDIDKYTLIQPTGITVDITPVTLSAPLLTDYRATTSTITVTAPTLPTGASKVQYSIDGVSWQDSNVFSNLSSDTTYSVTAKFVADSSGNYRDSVSSDALTVKTNNSIGGGTPVTTYPITVEDSRNGEVDSNRTRASSGTTVTLTVTPEEGYELDELTVTDKNGKAIKLTDKGDGKYTFTMPRSAVTVEATFRAVEPATPAWDECGRGPDCPAYHFTDLNLSLWYHDGIHFCVEHGLMNGTGATTFEPDTTTSRGMIVTILYRLEGTPTAGASSFTDVAADAYYADAVAWANANGIVMGYGNGKYGPDDPVTREQLAAILYRYAQYKGYDTTQGGMSIREFSDYEQISDYALEPMAWAVNAGLINGTTSTTLAPTGSGTRAQTAALLMRFCENIAK